VDQQADPRTFYRVRCDNCEAMSFGCYCLTNADAMREWNTRSADGMQEALEDIRRLLSYAENEGKSAAIKEGNCNAAWHRANAALAALKDKP